MTWFTENPTPIFVLGGISLIVLLVFLLKTGRGVIMLAMAGVVLCIVLAAAIDALVVTDREQVEQTLLEAVAAAERNDLDMVVSYISPSAQTHRADARRWIGQVVIEKITTFALAIDVDSDATPPTAETRFRWLATGDWKKGGAVHKNFAGQLTVQWRKEGDRWLVTDYQER